MICIYTITLPPAAYEPDMFKSRHASVRVSVRPLFLITFSVPKSLHTLSLLSPSTHTVLHVVFLYSSLAFPHAH